MLLPELITPIRVSFLYNKRCLTYIHLIWYPLVNKTQCGKCKVKSLNETGDISSGPQPSFGLDCLFLHNYLDNISSKLGKRLGQLFSSKLLV